MIMTITMNPCIDRTVMLDHLEIGEHNRVKQSIQQVSCGKGINVSTALQHLELETLCTGLNYTANGNQLPDALNAQGIANDLLPVPGSLRVNIKLTEASGRMTEVNENGTPVEPETADRMLAHIRSLLPKAEILVVDGSVPPGIRDTLYAEIITLAHEAGVRTVLDAAGSLLRHGLEAGPWLVKPNRFELETLLGVKLHDRTEAAQAARSLLTYGIQMVCLSMGSDGALLVNADGTWFCGNLDIPVRGVQGAGDSMVAGLCAAALQNLPAQEMLKWGVAAAHASLLLPGTELCRKEDFEQLLPKL